MIQICNRRARADCALGMKNSLKSYYIHGPGFISPQVQQFFFSSLLLDGSGAHPASYPMIPGVKRPGSESDHSSPSSADVKSAWSCTSTPPIHLHGMKAYPVPN
jgi:hypothetical protein